MLQPLTASLALLSPVVAPPPAAASAGPADPIRITCRFFVVRRSDGTGGVDEALIEPMMRDLNYGFRDTPFVFDRIPGVIYIDNDDYYGETGIPLQAIITEEFYSPGALHWYIVPDIPGAPAGTWYGPPNTSSERGIFMEHASIGSPANIVTPTHEAGHIFNLLHPFETVFGLECTSGSNCAVAGDFVCDTPSSPVLHGGNTTGTGIYFAGEPGPCTGDPPFMPDVRNYMDAGWPAGHILRDRFTAGQLERMLFYLNLHQADLLFGPPVLVDCDGNGIDDVEEILDGSRIDGNQDMVLDDCQVFPQAGDLLVCGMTSEPTNRPRYFDGATGEYRGELWNGMTWTHQLRMGPDGLVYMPRLTLVERMSLETGRTVDNFIDGVLEGVGVLVDLLWDEAGDILVLDNTTATIRRYDGTTGESLGLFASLGGVMSSPKYMDHGPDGAIHVVANGAGGNTIQRVDPASGALLGSLITPGAGGLIAGQGLLFHDDGFLYVSNGAANSVIRYDAETGAYVPPAFVASGSGGLSNPHSLRFGPDGHLYVASRGTHSVKRYDGTSGREYLGDFVAAGAGGSPGTGGLNQPTGLLFIPDAPCPADVDADGTVDVQDLVAIILAWGTSDAAADVNGDGAVDVADLVAVIVGWGPCSV